MKKWEFEVSILYKICVEYNDRRNEYYVSVRNSNSGWEIASKTFKNKGSVNRFLSSWGVEEKI